MPTEKLNTEKNQRDILGEQLYEAAKKGNLEQVNKLITKGADINWQHKDGTTPIWVAMEQKQFIVVDELKKKGADFKHVPEGKQNSPIAAILPLYCANRDEYNKLALTVLVQDNLPQLTANKFNKQVGKAPAGNNECQFFEKMQALREEKIAANKIPIFDSAVEILKNIGSAIFSSISNFFTGSQAQASNKEENSRPTKRL